MPKRSWIEHFGASLNFPTQNTRVIHEVFAGFAVAPSQESVLISLLYSTEKMSHSLDSLAAIV